MFNGNSRRHSPLEIETSLYGRTIKLFDGGIGGDRLIAAQVSFFFCCRFISVSPSRARTRTCSNLLCYCAVFLQWKLSIDCENIIKKKRSFVLSFNSKVVPLTFTSFHKLFLRVSNTLKSSVFKTPNVCHRILTGYDMLLWEQIWKQGWEYWWNFSPSSKRAIKVR